MHVRKRWKHGHLGGIPLGCDQLGHRRSHTLARAGYFPGDELHVRRLPNTTLLNWRGIGPVGLRRIREYLPTLTILS